MTSESEKTFLSYAIETETVLLVVILAHTLVFREGGVRHPYNREKGRVIGDDIGGAGTELLY